MTILDSGFMMENGSIELPCTPEQEKSIVRELTEKAESSLREGNLYFVVSNRWFASWQRYTGLSTGAYAFNEASSEAQPSGADRPGPINNTDIVANGSQGDDPQLLRTLEEGSDYVLVPQEVWERLYGWYKGGPVLPRKMISAGDSKQFSVEVFPLCLYLVDLRDKSETVIRLSKKASLHDLFHKVCQIKGVEPEKARIFDYFNKQKHTVLVQSRQTLEESNLQMDQHILLEVKSDGFWPSGFDMDSTGNNLQIVPVDPSRSSVTIAGGPSLSNGYSTGHSSSIYSGISLNSSYGNMEDGYDGSKSVTRGEGGLAGLQNLGNTCFMNSALQCLVHTPPIVEYFLQDYTDEINKQNPLGMHGELALAFGELLRKLWSSGRAPVAPRAFKGKLSRFAPQFSGYNQHDSQELLAFLLDGLHEDLNRVKCKPYVEVKDDDNRPDYEIADEYWKNHLARNDSIIVDVCQGQYRSTLVCPVCSKVSVTFDPFMYLSLPLPSTSMRTMTLTVVTTDGSAEPSSYTIHVPKNGKLDDLVKALSTACCLRVDETLLIAEIFNNRIIRFLEESANTLSLIRDEDRLVAYRVPKDIPEGPQVVFTHQQKEEYYYSGAQNEVWRAFGIPLVTYSKFANGSDIRDLYLKLMSPFLMTQENSIGNSDGLPNSVSEEEKEPEDATISRSSEYEANASAERAGACSDSEFLFYEANEKGSAEAVEISMDEPVNSGSLPGKLNVFVRWPDKMVAKSNTKLLCSLPEVFKLGFSLKRPQESVSLYKCLEAFLKEEPLGPEDMWFCPVCKKHYQATKKLDLWRLPEILVIHLKRFSYSRFLKNKLETFVDFPVHDLDLSAYIAHKEGQTSHRYMLYALSNHYGSMGGGHYTAYVHHGGGHWYDFDDSHVSPISEDKIKSSAAYVLFYRRTEDA